ncbi:DUF2946 family protein [Ottowia testudinis]|uniref:DUF2946 family protein n=1 Tax=Ottowia testudinis TaxID=2816950 RepID=A0A975CHU8_9BURK|nr:DUF2946 family protein [Ottowia testudinis]QTD45202.1 DUF2946 family protein [Ottowia testudinis]
MDDIVKQAMVKWPNVPHAYGWLGLDARGHWYLRDARAQALGGFASGAPGAKGSRIEHQKLIEFIQRNYQADEAGRWFFQNGPQRVFVELEVTPWIWRLAPDGAVSAHDGRPAAVREVFTDEAGRVFLRTDLGFGLVHTQDVPWVADAVEAGRWHPRPVVAADLAAREGYVSSPQAASAAG